MARSCRSGTGAVQACCQAAPETRQHALPACEHLFSSAVNLCLIGLLQSDEQLSWVMQLLEGPMQRDTVQALVARIMGDAQPTTVPLDALDGLRTGQC